MTGRDNVKPPSAKTSRSFSPAKQPPGAQLQPVEVLLRKQLRQDAPGRWLRLSEPIWRGRRNVLSKVGASRLPLVRNQSKLAWRDECRLRLWERRRWGANGCVGGIIDGYLQVTRDGLRIRPISLLVVRISGSGRIGCTGRIISAVMVFRRRNARRHWLADRAISRESRVEGRCGIGLLGGKCSEVRKNGANRPAQKHPGGNGHQQKAHGSAHSATSFGKM